MTESNYAIHAHIRKTEDYQISNGTSPDNQIVIKTEKGDVILTIDRNIALTLAMDLVKVVTTRIKHDVNKEIEALKNQD